MEKIKIMTQLEQDFSELNLDDGMIIDAEDNQNIIILVKIQILQNITI